MRFKPYHQAARTGGIAETPPAPVETCFGTVADRARLANLKQSL